jgi:hypothetical protein
MASGILMALFPGGEGSRQALRKGFASMKTNALRTVAVALGLSVCTIAHAQSNYSSPAQWNNFRPVSEKGQAKAAAKKAAKKEAAQELELPAPVAEIPAPVADPLHTSEPVGAGCQNCQDSQYAQAVAASWAGSVRLPMKRWFGSANLLFFTLEEGRGEYIASGLGSDLYTSLVDPKASTGFDVSFGRYLHCGRWGAGVSYMLWNPEKQGFARFSTPGTIAAANPAYSQISIAHGTLGTDTVANLIAANARGMYLKRDVAFQGIEANLFSFGLMGARRVSHAGCGNGSVLGFGANLGHRLSHGRGFGGASGPLARPCGSRIRVMTSHGFRWFQAKDFVERGWDVDGTDGFQSEDIYEKVDIDNNLYGYQFGGRLTYLITCRLNLSVGGKLGIYGNYAEMKQCVGTRSLLAYQTGSPTAFTCNGNNDNATDTALATLGELDLGLGYRISNCWSIRGGYRLLGMTGVANSMDSHPVSYASMADAGRVRANDNYVLQGGYVGLEFNW